jgi:hypothetical protein
MIAGIDVGFGWTKVVCEDGKTFKFPSWIAYYTPTPISGLDRVTWGGKTYVVGKDVRFESQRIEIPGISELVKYFPVFLKYVETRIGRLDKIITGIPPKHKDYVDELQAVISEICPDCMILPQGVGIFADVIDRVNDEVLIMDIGFNTLDYLIVTNESGEWTKKKGNTIEKLGLVRAVEIFRGKLPDEIGYAKNFSFSRLIEVFERGSIVFEGEDVDLKGIRKACLDEYTEMLKTRMIEELGKEVEDMKLVVVAGGGANIVKLNIFKGSKVIVPENPEFSQARGYLKLGTGMVEI